MATTFISKARNFQVTLETEGLPVTDVQGRVVDRTRGKRVRFNQGIFVASESSARELGLSVADLIERMRNTATFNREYVEKGNEPDRVLPTTEDLLRQITTAAVDRNARRLRDIVAAEKESHNRPEVIAPAEIALGRMGDTETGRRAAGRPKVVEPEVE